MKMEIVASLIFFGFIVCVLVIPVLVILHKWDTALKPLESVVDDLVKKELKSLPSAQPEQRWIPCSERLPIQNGVYVVTRTISDGFEYGNITDCCYFDGTNTWHDDTRVNHGRKYLADVIAWQPLPKPYKG